MDYEICKQIDLFDEIQKKKTKFDSKKGIYSCGRALEVIYMLKFSVDPKN